jgi:predicted nicotinamide N-methyase
MRIKKMTDKFPGIDLNFRPLYDLLHFPYYTELLYTAIELKIFNFLTDFTTSDAVAQAIKTHPENTRFFLDGLVSIDLVIKKKGQYKNAPIAQKFLVEGVPIYLGSFLTNSGAWYRPVLENMTELVKNGPHSREVDNDVGSSDLWAEHARTGANYQRAGVGQLMANIISKLPEFPRLKKMLDLGGGAGLIGLAIVDAHPNMKGVILDHPSVIKVAEDFIKEYEMESRMETMGGNYLIDSIGEGYDLIFAASTLNFAKHDLDSLFKKIYDALNPNGLFITAQDGLTNENTKPTSIVLGFLCIALMGNGYEMSFKEGEIAEAMIRMGFKSVQSRKLTKFFDIELTIARK